MSDDTKLVGTESNDTINGDESHEIIVGDAGNDTINAGDGYDIVRGGSGNDVINGGAGHDVLLGDSGNDTIDGGSGNDTINGGTGDDTLTGGAGADRFVFNANAGNDTITDFNKTEDTIDLSMLPNALGFSDLTLTATSDGTGTIISHADLGGTITVDGVTPSEFTASMFSLPDGSTTSFHTSNPHTMQMVGDTLDSAGNCVAVLADAGNTQITGSAGRDRLLGGEGDDTITGGAHHDTLFGEEGDDTLDGGTGRNHIWGGSGEDTFVIQAQSINWIGDFENGQDQIDLSAFADVAELSDLTITAGDTGAVIDMSAYGGSYIFVKGVSVSDLDASDFIFHQPDEA